MEEARFDVWKEPLNSYQMEVAAEPKCPLCGSIDTFRQTRLETGTITKLWIECQRDLVSREFRGEQWIYVHRCRNCFLCFFEPMLPGSPAFYRSLQSFDWYYMEDKEEYEMAMKRIPRGARLLEVGCGSGRFAKRLIGVHYTGLEYSESAVEVARAGDLDVRAQSVQEHSLTHKSAYQVVCAFQVLEHVPQPASFIAACIDCLEVGGLLIYGVPSDDSFMRFAQNDTLNLPPHHMTRWPDKTLEAIPTFFPVSLVAIEHELVSDIHLRGCVSVMIRKRINALFNRSEEIVDRSFASRLVGKCANLLAGLASPIFEDPVIRPRGHTVVATYRKQSPPS
ncbi:MAG TPA: class I SAM-dependent methyltransferase [Desulfomonilaceae bacterium]|nr:class I SAM-dependent methyltransferase [Desulfomonilaceae bacterium]